jgi:hypothetical protein
MGDMQKRSALALVPNSYRSERPMEGYCRRRMRVVSLLVAVPAMLVTACDSGSGSTSPTSNSSTTAASAPSNAPAPSSSSSVGPVAGIVDPLSEITDKNNSRYVDSAVKPLLHSHGVGPSRFQLKPDAGTSSLRVYVACTPTSQFKAAVGKGFSGECASRFENFADIPVPSGDLNLNLTVPGTTQFVVVVIPTP